MVVAGQQLPNISVPQAPNAADGPKGSASQPGAAAADPAGEQQLQHQQASDACLKAVNPVKLKKSSGWEQSKQQEALNTSNNNSSNHYNSNNTSGHSGNGNNKHQSRSRGPSGVFDSVPFTPSQGVTRTPSSSSGQFNFDPYWGWGLYSGRESPYGRVPPSRAHFPPPALLTAPPAQMACHDLYSMTSTA
eukprot:1159944-Pelagomonas_calceolata.AAC.1